MPTVSIDAMNKQLAEISQCVSVSAIALLILDGAGWHSSPQLIVPDNIVLLPFPSYAPELNATENIWEYLRGNCLSHCVCHYEAIVDACCDAWNTLMATPDVIASIGTREWHRSEFSGIKGSHDTLRRESSKGPKWHRTAKFVNWELILHP